MLSFRQRWKGRLNMGGYVAMLISWLALGATLYELYLQRIHNEKSLQPLGQIDLEDRQGHLFVHITNQGMGPMIIEQLLFSKEGKTYSTLGACLDLAPDCYTAVDVNESVRKVILPQGRFVVFETRLDKNEKEVDEIRQQLSALSLQVAFRDIYDNQRHIARDFHWYSRYKEPQRATG